jgi:hypothetical protein
LIFFFLLLLPTGLAGVLNLIENNTGGKTIALPGDAVNLGLNSRWELSGVGAQNLEMVGLK